MLQQSQFTLPYLSVIEVTHIYLQYMQVDDKKKCFHSAAHRK